MIVLIFWGNSLRYTSYILKSTASIASLTHLRMTIYREYFKKGLELLAESTPWVKGYVLNEGASKDITGTVLSRQTASRLSFKVFEAILPHPQWTRWRELTFLSAY